ncbi:MAG TPA: P1 family peptidase [Cyclobacteriaceae bacterium]|nr:P1 family peptidase [Cyclobacteriaceae bacterium]
MRPIILIFFLFLTTTTFAQSKRLRDYNITIGILPPGKTNSITDVTGVKVGHTTLNVGDSIHTGVTAIIPHGGNIFKEKVPAAIYIGNGFGKLAGYSQVKELGNIETPIILTNTLSVPVASDALITYTLNLPGNENVRSVNSIVGETNDGYLNDIRGRHVKQQHVLDAITSASTGPVQEGNVGAGTGTICFGYKGGIGTASRVLPPQQGGYTVGVLVQTNFGGNLEIAGVPIQQALNNATKKSDGSCMTIVITDAPIDSRNLERVAKRAFMGLAKTGGVASNGSGDYVIALSVAPQNFVKEGPTYKTEVISNDNITPIFIATIEATEEAIINSLFAAQTMTAKGGKKIEALPVPQVIDVIKKYHR